MDPVVSAALIKSGIDVTGSVLAGIGQTDTNEKVRKALDFIARETEKLKGTVSENANERISDLERMYGTTAGGTPTEVQGMDKAYQDYIDIVDKGFSQYDVDPEAYGDFKTFDLEGATKAEMNPYLTDITEAAIGDVTQSAANAGQLYSGAAGKDIARATYDIRAKEQGAARERAIQREGQKYKEWSDKFDRILKGKEFNRGGAALQADLTKGAYDIGASTRREFSGATSDIRAKEDEQRIQLEADRIAALGKKKGTPTGFGAFAQGFGGGSTTEV